MKKLQKGFVGLPVLIAVIVLIFIGTGTYVYVAKKVPTTVVPNINTPPVSTPIGTSNNRSLSADNPSVSSNTYSSSTPEESIEPPAKKLGVKITSTANGNRKFSGTISQALKEMGNEKCSYSKTEMNTYAGYNFIYSGTIVVNSEKFRVDRKSVGQDITTESHLIYDGNFLYTWSDSMKFKIDTKKLFPTASRQDNNQELLDPGQDLTRVYNFSCQDASSEASTFLPPVSIIFIELPSTPK